MGNTFRGIVLPEDLDTAENSIQEQITENQYNLDYSKGGQSRCVEDYGHFVYSELDKDIFYVFVGDTTGKSNFHRKYRSGRNNGMNAHLPKPLNVDHLLELMLDMI